MVWIVIEVEATETDSSMWGRDIRTLCNLRSSDAEESFEVVDQLDLRLGTSVFLFGELLDALVLVRRGKLSKPHAVIEIVGSA